jgi:hypothetical protein
MFGSRFTRSRFRISTSCFSRFRNLARPGPLSGYFLDQSDHLDALRDQACPSRMHCRQKLAAVTIDSGELFHVDFDLFGG